uniref:Uncharacterized protein n=1 Tax=Anopheles dirus TaxID=7168 RepID=A0A182NWN7_9DIPT
MDSGGLVWFTTIYCYNSFRTLPKSKKVSLRLLIIVEPKSKRPRRRAVRAARAGGAENFE